VRRLDRQDSFLFYFVFELQIWCNFWPFACLALVAIFTILSCEDAMLGGMQIEDARQPSIAIEIVSLPQL
jgi:hypothetical protein